MTWIVFFSFVLIFLGLTTLRIMLWFYERPLKVRLSKTLAGYKGGGTADVNYYDELFGLEHLPLNGLGGERKSGWGNLGYWQTGDYYEQAAARLFRETVKPLTKFEEPEILHLGNGCGDGDEVLFNDFDAHSVTAANPSRAQAVMCRDKLGDHDGYELHEVPASVVVAESENETFDAVVYVDCGYHFLDRKELLQNCYDKLKPGGLLLGADLCLADHVPEILKRIFGWFSPIFGIPRVNLIRKVRYSTDLYGTGYREITMTPVTEFVLGGFYDFWQKNEDQFENLPTKIKNRYKYTAKVLHFLYRRRWLDFVLIQAEKTE